MALIFATSLHAEGTVSSSQAVVELQAWLKLPANKRPAMEGAAFAKIPLEKKDAEAAKAALWADHEASIRTTRTAEMQAKEIELGGKKMKFGVVDFPAATGAPKGGRSLFISMHGGGNAPPSVNESQWRNQIALSKVYKPAEGIYVAPRAPTDTWNLWHEAHIDTFFDRLIENMIVLEKVNPNRVYILGYSAGGDGVYQLAPRLSDHWAAAAMMAGHPNESSPNGLRNVPIAIQVGAKDDGFKRNEIAGKWGTMLDDLQKADPKGYEHFTELHAGKGHWMDTNDRKAIPWMEKFTRNPLPEKIVWRQDDVTHDRSYWLAVPKGKAAAGQEIIAERKGQSIGLSSATVHEITVLFNDSMLNLDQPVVVTAGGKELFSGKPERTIAVLARTLTERGDPDLVFSAQVSVALP